MKKLETIQEILQNQGLKVMDMNTDFVSECTGYMKKIIATSDRNNANAYDHARKLRMAD